MVLALKELAVVLLEDTKSGPGMQKVPVGSGQACRGWGLPRGDAL